MGVLLLFPIALVHYSIESFVVDISTKAFVMGKLIKFKSMNNVLDVHLISKGSVGYLGICMVQLYMVFYIIELDDIHHFS